MPYNKSEKRRQTLKRSYNKSDEKRDAQHSERKLIRDRRHYTPLESIAKKKEGILKKLSEQIESVQNTIEEVTEKHIIQKSQDNPVKKNKVEKQPIIKQGKLEAQLLKKTFEKPPAYARKKTEPSIANPYQGSSSIPQVIRKISMQPNEIMFSAFTDAFDFKILGGLLVFIFLKFANFNFPSIFFIGYIIYIAVRVYKTFEKIKYRAIKIDVLENGDLILFYKNVDVMYKKLLRRGEVVFEIKLVPKKANSKTNIEASLKIGNQGNRIEIYDTYQQILRFYVDLLQEAPEKNIRNWEYENLKKLKKTMDRTSQQRVNLIIDRYQNQRKV